MLYNESTGKPKVQADVFSLESLIAWLEAQSADKEYCYTSSGYCLLSQYFAAKGFRNACVGPADVIHTVEKKWDTTDVFSVAFHDIAIGRPRTFGAALSRARAQWE